jgi:voltage-gated potassium channel
MSTERETRGAPEAGDDTPPGTLERERDDLLQQLDDLLEGPMTVLAVGWLVLVVVELTAGLSPFLSAVNVAIWGAFVVHFLVELALAPRKRAYLRRNWLTVLSLLLPALRVLRFARVLRVVRAARGTRLLRVVGGANRGMRTLGRVMGRRGLGYVLALTALVCLLGAAGIYAFEREVPGGPITSYGVALWWTAMTLTTMGADFFPTTPEGRLLCLLLAIYGFTVFGYVTAAVASFFVARDAEDGDGEVAGAASIDALRAEIAALSRKLDARAEAPRVVGGSPPMDDGV